VAYGLNVSSGDPYADGGGFPSGGNVTDIRFDPYQFVDSGSPAYPNAGDTGNHSSASFIYDLGNTTPEPTSLGLLGAAALGLLLRRRHLG
jgi:hypothetical protein